ncbi:proteasome-type protease [Roseomonas marmotae]|uniref:Proteasome-type protease n=1 Tax=Roseomonas marmotae TaxID=2768161 RepID=A0ABS3K8X7_9PROT|nr:proteasome-type protease [Roseomonas marmotae]MBO1073918.1 proteasome-type protease [Roseomonas marmotae]QTI78465.1 proteasome-type protease [Roseomonas marmotae]
MTYCVGLWLEDGLVMLADTRTNAGVDNISTFSKMHTATSPGERMLCLLSAGNLAITQAVWNRLCEGVALEGEKHTLFTIPSMFRAAQLVGAAIRAVHASDGPSLKALGIGFDVSIMLGGQIAGGPVRLYLVYAAGNFIEATPDTPFLQIGEHKYGKPILDRALNHQTSLEDGVKLTLVSMDSTLRSNLSVGLPLDLLVYKAGRYEVRLQQRVTEADPYFRDLREAWSVALRDAYQAMPCPGWL